MAVSSEKFVLNICMVLDCLAWIIHENQHKSSQTLNGQEVQRFLKKIKAFHSLDRQKFYGKRLSGFS